MLLAFDPAVTGISSQPFVLYWNDETGERRHTPDCFVRRADVGRSPRPIGGTGGWPGARGARRCHFAFEQAHRICAEWHEERGVACPG
jgi:hypothetical protein